MKKKAVKGQNSEGISLFILAPHKPTAVCQTRAREQGKAWEKRERE